MGQKIWDVLTSCEGGWAAIGRDGTVVARAGSLEEAERLAAADRHRVTFVYSARSEAERPPEADPEARGRRRPGF